MHDETESKKTKYSTPRRNTYATWLEVLSRIGLLIIALSFLLYVSGCIESHLPIKDLPSYWGISASKYMKMTEYRGGWSWISHIHKADYMNFIGICFLASVTMICNFRLLLILIKQNDRVLAVICILQIIIIAFAASGIIAFGH